MTGRLVGLCGRKGSGKDAVGEILVGEGFWRFAFADIMKKMAYAIDPIIRIDQDMNPLYARLSELVDVYGWDEVKQIADARRFLQRLGTEGGRGHLHQDIWVDTLFAWEVDTLLTQGQNVVITDVRFINEIAAIKARGGELWRVERPNLGEDDDWHSSEREWRSAVADVVVTNDGTLSDLRECVLRSQGPATGFKRLPWGLCSLDRT
jgi:hypothetical protein